MPTNSSNPAINPTMIKNISEPNPTNNNNNTQGYAVTPGPEVLMTRNKYNYNDGPLNAPSTLSKLTSSYDPNQMKMNSLKDNTTSNDSITNHRLTALKTKSKSLLVKSNNMNSNNMIMLTNGRTNTCYPHQLQKQIISSPFQGHRYYHHHQQQNHHPKYRHSHVLHHSQSQNYNSRPKKFNVHANTKFGSINKDHFNQSSLDGFKTFEGHRTTNQNNSLLMHDPCSSLNNTHRNMMMMKYLNPTNEIDLRLKDETNLATCWLMKTGGGQDSLGYEKPSIMHPSPDNQTSLRHTSLINPQEAHLQHIHHHSTNHQHHYLYHHQHHHYDPFQIEQSNMNHLLNTNQRNGTQNNNDPNNVNSNLIEDAEN